MANSTVYIAAATNRYSQAAAISNNSLAAFGSSKLIALWDISNEIDRGINETLPGHEGLVTCVRFFSDTAFLSADDCGTLILWRKLESQWNLTAKIQAHEKAVSSLCTLDDLLVTGSSDASTIPLSGRYPLALALTYLPGSKALILAISGTDSKIHIWTRSENLFVHVSVLAGHEDWVKTLDFQDPISQGQTLVLASGSQDATIRLWNVEPWSRPTSTSQKDRPDSLNDELLDAFEASLGDVGEAEGGRQISLKRHIMTVKDDQGSSQQFSITFDALLIGHEAGVTSVAWKPPSVDSEPILLSTSTDSSVILWSQSTVVAPTKEGSTSIWINRQRFGDIGGQRLGGFVGGGWAQHGEEALAWGWTGSWRRWKCNTSTTIAHAEVWLEAGAISGHNGPVKGLDWSPTGAYLLSAGLDQTTRVHAVIPGSRTEDSEWHELSRPQIHGYDLIDVAFIDTLRFVSIADEKVARIFEAPRNFVNLIEELGVSKFTESEHQRPLAANVPPLGLSNKAVENAQAFTSMLETRERRPFEGELASTTLWPEIEKIFGHGYESMTLTVSPNKRFLATACKATTLEHAVVRVYDTTKYQPVGQPLSGHSLTVTRIAFSPDGNFVLSVSRDRSWRLFRARESGGFIPIAADKSHGRIIWDCAWASEGDVFATASRDKTVKIWEQQQANKWIAVYTIKTSSPATAVAFAPGGTHHRRRLAIGLETGEIFVYSALTTSTAPWHLDTTIPSRLAHIDHIHRLAWQPTNSGAPTRLASCSEDGTLKISNIPMTIE
ncbi:putative elongator complex protein 2 [Termitomyces sp. T112]|nr:putative elongator complex protein 2 [Termitomyces sp. T112]